MDDPPKQPLQQTHQQLMIQPQMGTIVNKGLIINTINNKDDLETTQSPTEPTTGGNTTMASPETTSPPYPTTVGNTTLDDSVTTPLATDKTTDGDTMTDTPKTTPSPETTSPTYP